MELHRGREELLLQHQQWQVKTSRARAGDGGRGGGGGGGQRGAAGGCRSAAVWRFRLLLLHRLRQCHRYHRHHHHSIVGDIIIIIINMTSSWCWRPVDTKLYTPALSSPFYFCVRDRLGWSCIF